MFAASLGVSIATVLASIGTLAYSRRQTNAANRQANAAKVQADAAQVQAAAALAQADTAAAQLRQLERQQTSQVLLTARATSAAETGVLPDNSPELVYRAIVTNRSARPIRNVSCRLLPVGQAPVMPAVCSQLIDYPMASARTAEAEVHTGRATHWQISSAGDRVSFIFPVEVERYPKAYVEARFADDDGVNWEIDGEERLAKLAEREGW